MARGVSEGQRRQGAIYERRIASMTYAELHCRTNFSFLSGASHPHELVAQAGALGLTALAITDLSGVYGVVRAWEARRKILAAHERGERDAVNGALIARPPRLIYGSELQLDPIPRDGGRRDPIATRHGDRRDPSGLRGADRREPSDALVVLARDGAGWSKLTALITRGRRRVAKGAFSLTQAEVRHAGGAHWVVLAGGPRSRLLRLLRRGEIAAVRRELFALREAFGDALFVEVTRHRRPGDGARSRAIAALAREINVPVVATNDVFFHAVERKRLQDILECLRLGVSLSEAGRRLWPNAERRLKETQAMRELFADLPDIVERTAEVAALCTFDVGALTYSYPDEGLSLGESADEVLGSLARQGLVERLGAARAHELHGRLDHELSIIEELHYAGYFLTMWEVV